MILGCDKLDQYYGRQQVLSGVTFETSAGSIGLLGPNGAGKSTLIKTCLAHLPVPPGRVRIAGLDPARSPLQVRQRVGYLPESEASLPGLSGLEYVAFCGQLSGMRRVDALGRAHRVLGFVGLGESRYRPLDGYSVGMRQRLKLAACLVHGAELLLLDEPTSGLDPAGRREMLEMVAELARRRGVHVMLSSHILQDVERTCDEVVLLHAGRVLFAGSREAFQRRESQRLTVRVKADAARMAEALRAEGCRVEAPAGAAGLEVELPAGGGPQLVWKTARACGLQIRHLAPASATLEQAYARAVTEAR
ncbi:MAG: ABC transporter ATP-binding protein [Deltaproteobacteria bacterium]|nr:ABC transporter ATP-binding protein [Deltaproteobacteria bacterium]